MRAEHYRSSLAKNSTRSADLTNPTSCDSEPRFPSKLDTIEVQWIVGNETIWWPARVLDISTSTGTDNTDQCIRGKLLYSALRSYGQEVSHVLFSVEKSSGQGLVTTLQDNLPQSQTSSWIFKSIYDAGSNGDTDASGSSHAFSDSTPDLTKDVQLNRKRISGNFAKQSTKKKRQKSSGEDVSPVNRPHSDDVHTKFDGLHNDKHSQRVPGGAQSQEDSDIRRRLQQLEDSVQVLTRPTPIPTTIPSDTVPPPASSVLLTLKWLLLKKIEKPLKPQVLMDISLHGVACTVLTVKCDCDILAFRAIASSLAKRHNPTLVEHGSSAPSSRIKFHPDYARTQCHSNGVDNLSISFTSFSDVMQLLSVHDEDDFERVLSSEVQTQSLSLLQIIGTLELADVSPSGDGNLDIPRNNSIHEQPVRHSDTVQPVSTTVTSVSRLHPKPEPPTKAVPMLKSMNIYVGSSPITELSNSKSSVVSPRIEAPYFSHIFRQTCHNFNELQGCYQSQWTISRKRTHFKVNTPEGLQQPPDNSKFFVLQWCQVKPPSTKKWSRDSHLFSCPRPGHLEMSIPAVFTSSSRNTKSLAALLDKTIEEILKQRILMIDALRPTASTNGTNSYV